MRARRCSSSVESSAHAIFGCLEAKKCGRIVEFDCHFEDVKNLPALEVFMNAAFHLSVEDLGSFCMIAWAIWDNRNLIFKFGKGKPSELVIYGAFSLMAEFQNSKKALSIQPSSVESRSCADWLAPPPGKYKLNTTAAIRKNGISFGVGTAIRDDKDLVLAAHSYQLTSIFNAEIGELIALREGLLLAQFYNLKVDVAEVISLFVVSFLNDSIPPVGESNFIVKDIKAMFLDVGISKCLAVSRSGNSLARKLALLAPLPK
ncbi:hypothetical protein EZV62_018319 [Acer yangbiense]|uniref:RNase H type-1 domain-containing protein n=1 Tax=Acer yangbiense TaxID=1000413 RepID=A0A5C7HL83_9ROSI|nr:hypothetical protein EZV62_018319 [Acer yangbiense]